jgi:uroporphyrinogen-III decarboxylase
MLNPIEQTYELSNRVVPVLSRRKYESDPFGYTIRDIVYEPAKVFDHQMYNIEQTLSLDSDWSPFLEPWLGVGIYADAFGSQTTWPVDDYPWTEPFIENIDEVFRLKMPAPGESPLMERVLRTIEYFKEQNGGGVPISMTDTQSPMNTASLIVRTEELLTACYTNPEAVHHLLDQITDLIIEFSKIQLEVIGSVVALPGHLFPAAGHRGISISDDNCSMVSADIYRQYFVPYFNRLARAFDGIYLHSCGDFSQNLEAMLEIEGLLGVNMHTGQGDMDPALVKKYLGGKCVVWGDVGIMWAQTHASLEEYFEQYYLPGYLADGEMRGVMVEAPPVEDMARRREMVAWTRESVGRLIP